MIYFEQLAYPPEPENVRRWEEMSEGNFADMSAKTIPLKFMVDE
jgi:hypothetical protein